MENYSDILLRYSRYPNSIFSAVHKEEKIKYIIKMVAHDSREEKNILPEVLAYQKISHQNVINMRQWFNHEKDGVWYTAMVLQFCIGGPIDFYMDQDDITEIKLFEVMMLLVQGVKHLHDRNIIHRDIKPDNILLSRGKPKIADLGSAQIMKESAEKMKKNVGTLFYSSPEIEIGDGVYDFKTDVWSLGLVFLEMIVGDRIQHLVKGQKAPCLRKSFPSSELLEKVTNKEMRKVIRYMLEKDSRKRYSINKVAEKLEKIIKNVKNNFVSELRQYEFSLEQEQVNSNSKQTTKKEEFGQCRVDPSRCRQIKKYIKQSEKFQDKTKKVDILIRYEDWRQKLWIKAEGRQVYYTYQTLPESIKEKFSDIRDFVTTLRKSSSGLCLIEGKKIVAYCEEKRQADLSTFLYFKGTKKYQRLRRIDYQKHMVDYYQQQGGKKEQEEGPIGMLGGNETPGLGGMPATITTPKTARRPSEISNSSNLSSQQNSSTSQSSNIKTLPSSSSNLKSQVEEVPPFQVKSDLKKKQTPKNQTPSSQVKEKDKKQQPQPEQKKKQQKQALKEEKKGQKQKEKVSSPNEEEKNTPKNENSSMPSSTRQEEKQKDPNEKQQERGLSFSNETPPLLRVEQTKKQQDPPVPQQQNPIHQEVPDFFGMQQQPPQMNIMREGPVMSPEEQMMGMSGQPVDLRQIAASMGRGPEIIPLLQRLFGRNGENIVPVMRRIQEVGGLENFMREQGMMPGSNRPRPPPPQYSQQLALMEQMGQMNPDNERQMQERMNFAQGGGRKGGEKSGDQPEELMKKIKIMEMVSGPEKRLLPEMYTRLGNSYFHRKKVNEAIETYTKAIEKYLQASFYRSDSSALNLYHLGKAYLAKEDDERSLKSFEDAHEIFLDIESKNVVAISKNLNAIGKIHLMAGKIEIAEDHFFRALQYIRSRFEGLDCYQRLYKADPLTNLGHIKYHESKYQEAMNKFQEAIQILKAHPDAKMKIINPMRGRTSAYFAVHQFEDGVNQMEMMFAQSSEAGKLREVKMDMKKWVEQARECFEEFGRQLIVKMLGLLTKNAPDEKELLKNLERLLM